MDHHDLEFKLSDLDEKTGVFRGLGAVFNNVDRQQDVIRPGAFTHTLKERDGPIPMLWSHDWKTPIGRFPQAKETPAGLEVTGELMLSVARAVEIRDLMKGGVIRGLSIGYETSPDGVKYRMSDGVEVRELHQVRLWEISACVFPANPLALISAPPKALAELETAFGAPGAIKQYFREQYGFSDKVARDLLAALRGRPPAAGRSEQLSPLQLAKAMRISSERETKRLELIETFSVKLCAAAEAEAARLVPGEKYKRLYTSEEQEAEYREACKVDVMLNGKVSLHTEKFWEGVRRAHRVNGGKSYFYDQMAHQAAKSEVYRSIVGPVVAKISAELTACKSADDRAALLYTLGWSESCIDQFREGGFCDY